MSFVQKKSTSVFLFRETYNFNPIIKSLFFKLIWFDNFLISCWWNLFILISTTAVILNNTWIWKKITLCNRDFILITIIVLMVRLSGEESDMVRISGEESDILQDLTALFTVYVNPWITVFQHPIPVNSPQSYVDIYVWSTSQKHNQNCQYLENYLSG